jgi:hypothetical protein
LGLEHALDCREGVEPGEDGGGGLVVEEAAVEGLADGFRETGDFADHDCIEDGRAVPYAGITG